MVSNVGGLGSDQISYGVEYYSVQRTPREYLIFKNTFPAIQEGANGQLSVVDRVVASPLNIDKEGPVIKDPDEAVKLIRNRYIKRPNQVVLKGSVPVLTALPDEKGWAPFKIEAGLCSRLPKSGTREEIELWLKDLATRAGVPFIQAQVMDLPRLADTARLANFVSVASLQSNRAPMQLSLFRKNN